MSIRLNSALLAAAALSLLPTAGSAQTKLLRFPDIAGDRVAFCYAGDLWTAPATGGAATRLTAHPGLELFPKFSPDGRWIAFTGQYEGDEQVYVIPAGGGQPKQLTYYPARGPMAPRHGYDNQVMGWTPDGSAILFRSLRDADGVRSEGRLYTVALKGGLPKALPMPTSGAGDLSPDGKRIAYSPLFRDFRTWKRYEGGWAQDLYLYDLASAEAKPFAVTKRTERDPMWIGDAVYFASDRDGTLNLYSYDLATEAVTKLTDSTTWDVRWPSSDNVSRIVYELDGELHVFDVRTKADRALAIFVPNDGVAMRPAQVSVEKQVEDLELSPKGERALVVARGDVFTVPIEKGPTRNLTNSSNAHDKWARWSPDGKRIAFVSDRSGEDEVWLVDQAGGKTEQVTTGGQAMRFAPAWSAAGDRLAFSDKDGKLYVVALAERKTIEIADDPRARSGTTRGRRRAAVHQVVWVPPARPGPPGKIRNPGSSPGRTRRPPSSPQRAWSWPCGISRSWKAQKSCLRAAPRKVPRSLGCKTGPGRKTPFAPGGDRSPGERPSLTIRTGEGKTTATALIPREPFRQWQEEMRRLTVPAEPARPSGEKGETGRAVRIESRFRPLRPD